MGYPCLWRALPVSHPINLFSHPSMVSWSTINIPEPLFMDSALSAAFEPIAFLQRLHEGFLLSPSFCFMDSLLPPPCCHQPGDPAQVCHGSHGRTQLRDTWEGTLMPPRWHQVPATFVSCEPRRREFVCLLWGHPRVGSGCSWLSLWPPSPQMWAARLIPSHPPSLSHPGTPAWWPGPQR